MGLICDDIISLGEKIKKIALSEKKNKEYEYNKISARPFRSKKGNMWQLERFKNNQVFHLNMSENDFLSWLEAEGTDNFRQCCVTAEGTTVHYTIFSDKTKRKVTGNEIKNVEANAHNKEKKYILSQG